MKLHSRAVVFSYDEMYDEMPRVREMRLLTTVSVLNRIFRRADGGDPVRYARYEATVRCESDRIAIFV